MKVMRTATFLIAFTATLFCSRNGYSSDRRVPEIPAPGEKLRVIIDTDAACEIDDLYAIALAVLYRDRFEIEGFVAAHFGDAGGPEGIDKSLRAIETVLEMAGLKGEFPVKRGSAPFQYSAVPVESEGVDFIIQRAMATDKDDPLWVISLGACTNIASAYLKEPKIVDRVVVFWHGRTRWPDKAWNFNVYNDLKAARILFRSQLPLVLFDTGTYLRCPMDKSERTIRPYGRLGQFLHDFRLKNEWYQSPTKGFFDLGDVAALVDPSLVYWEVVDAPSVNWDMMYDHRKTNGKMVRIYQIDSDRTFALLHKRLADAFPQR